METDLKHKKQWQTPMIFFIDNTEVAGGTNNAFFERSVKNGLYYAEFNTPAHGVITFNKTVYNHYHS